MAPVDPDDDAIERFVVLHRAYDPARRERRNQVLAAFDDAAEHHAAIEAAAAELGRRRSSGEVVDPREGISGVVWPPGHHRQQRAGRLLRRAVQHGARFDEETWDRLASDLPPGTALQRAVLPPDA